MSKWNNWTFNSKEEFFNYALKMVNDHIDRIDKNIDTVFTDVHVRDQIKTKIEKYHKQYDNKNVAPLNKIINGLSIALQDTKEWASFSTNVSQETYKDIMTRSILNGLIGCDYLCYDFLVFNVFTDVQFIRDIIYTSSIYFDIDKFIEYDEDHINNAVKEIISKELGVSYRNTTIAARCCRFNIGKLDTDIINKLVN